MAWRPLEKFVRMLMDLLPGPRVPGHFSAAPVEWTLDTYENTHIRLLL